MTSKLRVKLGRIELEFEGSEDFIKQELMTVLDRIKAIGAAVTSTNGDDNNTEDADETKPKKKVESTLSTSTIAATIGVSSGPELVIAALARLCLVGGAEKASRKQITAEMRNATAYFKETYVGNLTPGLKTLITSQRINDLGSGNYSLTATERTALEAKLADAN